MRSDSATASRTSWVTSSVVQPAACQRCSNQSWMRLRVSASSAPKGSSSNCTGRPWMTVRKSAARWRIPPESCAGRWRSKPARPNSAIIGAARARASRRGNPSISSPRVTLSMIRRQGSNASRCGMKAKAPALASGCSIRPRSGAISPISSRKSVDLPQPEGPRIDTNSPGFTESDSRSSTGTPSRLSERSSIRSPLILRPPHVASQARRAAAPRPARKAAASAPN